MSYLVVFLHIIRVAQKIVESVVFAVMPVIGVEVKAHFNCFGLDHREEPLYAVIVDLLPLLLLEDPI